VEKETAEGKAQTEQWKPKDDLESFFNPKPETNYKAPEALPEPANDWLPSPVNDWLDSL
jgi:hypothetical protein